MEQATVETILAHFAGLAEAFHVMEARARDTRVYLGKHLDSETLAEAFREERIWNLAAHWLSGEVRIKANSLGIDLEAVPKIKVEPIPF